MPAIRPVGNPALLFPNEREPLSFSGYTNCDLLESGTAALALALISIRECNYREQPEVVIPAYACPDLVAAAQFANYKVVIVDTDTDSPRIDKHQLKQVLNTNTIAVIGISLLGIREDIEQIKALVGNDITVIEDSAQWFPHNEAQTFYGDMVILSYGRGKPVSISNGGMLLHNLANRPIITATDNGKIRQFFWVIKMIVFNILLNRTSYGLLKKIPALGIGKTAYHPLTKITAMPGGIARVLTTNTCAFRRRNLTICEHYRKYLKNHQYEHMINLPDTHCIPEDYQLLRYPLLIRNPKIRARILAKSEHSGLGLGTMYPQTLDQFPDTCNLCHLTQPITNAHLFAKQLITLPTHSNVKMEDANKIIELLKECL